MDLQLSINAQGRLQSEEEFSDISVKSTADGALTRLRDIARLEMGAADYSLRSLLNNDAAVGMGIFPRLARMRSTSRKTSARRWPN